MMLPKMEGMKMSNEEKKMSKTLAKRRYAEVTDKKQKYILALYGMNVIDSGVAVLNMHAPWEAISKADLYEALKGYIAFLRCAGM